MGREAAEQTVRGRVDKSATVEKETEEGSMDQELGNQLAENSG